MNYRFLKQLIYFVVLVSIVFSCVENDGDPLPGLNLPTSSITNMTTDATSLSGLSATLTVLSGDSPLDVLRISKHGSTDLVDDISIDGSAVEQGVITLSGSDKTSFSYDMDFHLIPGKGGAFLFEIIAENKDEVVQALTFEIKPDLRLPSGESNLVCAKASTKSLKFTGLLGTSRLLSFVIFEDGVALDIARIKINGVTVSSNPILLSNDLLDGFTENVDFLVHDIEATKTYTFRLIDQNGLTDEIGIAISTE